jgi:hypothetical protein
MKLQAKHIPDQAMLLAIDALRQIPYSYPNSQGLPIWRTRATTMLVDIENLWPSLPPKVIRAKLNGLIKRGIIDGCTCGCRGDFKILDATKAQPTTLHHYSIYGKK